MKKEKVFNFLLSKVGEGEIWEYSQSGNEQILAIANKNAYLGPTIRYRRYKNVTDLSKILRRNSDFLYFLSSRRYASKYKAMGVAYNLLGGEEIRLQEYIDDILFRAVPEEEYPDALKKLISDSMENMNTLERLLKQRDWVYEPQKKLSPFERSVLQHAQKMCSGNEFLQNVVRYILLHVFERELDKDNMEKPMNPVEYYLYKTYFGISQENIAIQYIEKLEDFILSVYAMDFIYLKQISSYLDEYILETSLNDTEWSESKIKNAIDLLLDFLDFD